MLKNLRNNVFLKNMYRTVKGLLRSTIRCLKRVKVKDNVLKVRVDGYRNVFFGYYDKSPFCATNENHIIVHANNANPYHKPSPNEKTDILIVDWRTGKIIRKLGETYSWNWQQGARVHWIDESTYVFNQYVESDNKYKAVIGNIVNENTRLLPLPVQETHPKGIVFSISYEALQLIRPDYGYRNKQATIDDIKTEKLSAYYINEDIIVDIITIEELLFRTENYIVNQKISKSKINHVLCSPNADGIVFLHRYFVGDKRVSDLYYTDLKSTETKLLLHDKNLSHYTWINDKKLLYTGHGQYGFGYYLLDILTLENNFILSYSDGHPYFYKEKYVITDTYPDRHNIRHVVKLDLIKRKIIAEIGSFKEPFLAHGETRCDLHPSISKTGKFLQIDIFDKSGRGIGIIELE